MTKGTRKVKYSESYNPIRVYWDEIAEGRPVSSKVYKVYKELIRIMDDPESEWRYNSKQANHALEFVENYCRHSKGTYGGKRFRLETWQKALVSATFGFIHKETGLRKFKQVMLVVGRKNGKSTLSAAVGLYLMIADGEAGAEVYACATKKDQAKIIWLEAKKMVRKSPTLLRRIKLRVAEMLSDYNESSFKPLGSDSDTLDGLNVHGGLLDEIHAWKTKDLYDVIVDGTSAREQPLIFITTTAGTVRESIYDILYDEAVAIINGFGSEVGYKNETFLPIIYELDNREEWTDSECWAKANPGLGTIKSIAYLKDKVNKAKENSLHLKNLLCKDFCVRETSTEAWLSFEDINNETIFDITELKPSYGIGGVDLSATTDLTAAKMIFKVTDDDNLYVISKYWLPEDLLRERVEEDKIPYDLWVEQGYVELVPGNKIHPKYITQWFIELYKEYDIYPYYVGYDAWAAEYWVDEMATSFGKENMIPVIQGKKTLSAPMHDLAAEFKAKRIIYNNNPVDKWCLTNTSVDIDRNGNIQPHKGKNQRRRIDGTAALLDAYTVLYNKESEYIARI